MKRALTPETIQLDDFPSLFRDAAREIATFALMRGREVPRGVSQVLDATDKDLRTIQLRKKLNVADVIRWIRKEQELINAHQQTETAMSQDLPGSNSQNGFDVAG